MQVLAIVVINGATGDGWPSRELFAVFNIKKRTTWAAGMNFREANGIINPVAAIARGNIVVVLIIL